MHPPPAATPSLFDGQARAYERRAALPPGVGAEIARAVTEVTALGRDDLLVEIGAGTGLVGRFFATGGPRYLGLDLSLDMLALFRAKRGAAGHPLAQADGNRTWPVAGGVAAAIFSSRALHLLSTPHVATQARRIARAGGAALVTGRLRYERGGIRERIAVRMRSLLREEGYRPRGGERMQRRLVAVLGREDREPIPRRRVACWSATATPRQAISEWRRKPGLGGLDPDAGAKRRVLDRLEEWARAETGDLDRVFETGVAYDIEGVWIR